MVDQVIITGASSGIGADLAKRLLSQGMEVIGLSRSCPDWLQKQAHYHHCSIDFSKKNFDTKVREIEKKYPLPDALVLCAGYGDFRECEQWSLESMDRMMHVNFLSQAWIVRSWLPKMKRRRKGKIILVGSECSLKGAKKASLYAASKFAIRGFAQSIREECAKADVSVNLILPGLVNTEFFEALSFQPGTKNTQSLAVESVTDAMLMVLNHSRPAVFDEIIINPISGAVASK